MRGEQWPITLVAILGLVFFGASSRCEGGMQGFLKMKDPEQRFEVELKLYNAVSLPTLLPSSQAPVPRTYANELVPGGHFTRDGSDQKYIFGSIRYKSSEQPWGFTVVTLEITSPSDPQLTAELGPLTIQGVSTHPTYFLLPAGSTLGPVPEEQIRLTYRIVRAKGIPPPED